MIEEIINRILKEYGVEKLSEVQAITPVRTGFLKDNFVLTTEMDTLNLSNNAFYAGFVDRGTRFMAARNFTAPFYQDLSSLQERIAAEIGGYIALQIKGNIENKIELGL